MGDDSIFRLLDDIGQATHLHRREANESVKSRENQQSYAEAQFYASQQTTRHRNKYASASHERLDNLDHSAQQGKPQQVYGRMRH
jgi:hypothetical protein